MNKERTLGSAALMTLLCCGQPQATPLPSATSLYDTELLHAQRQGRFFVAELKQPHRVISTASINGGEQLDLKFLVNHQSMEANNDRKRFEQQLSQSKAEYHQSIAKQLQLPAAQMALMGTAANIQQLAVSHQHFKQLTVTAFVTAGVKGNAQRAGDPTRWYETADGNKPVPSTDIDAAAPKSPLDNNGTINILLHINQPLGAGAQNKLAMLATEAKSAALAELAVASRVSPHLATGTGTDQLMIAAPLTGAQPPLHSGSGHLKLGELSGRAVREAVLEALRWQNQLDAANGGNILYILERFGFDSTGLLQQLQTQLAPEDFALLQDNLPALLNDSRAAAAVYAYAELLDRLQYGNLPDTISFEALRDQAAQIAVAVSAKPELWPHFWKQLQLQQPLENREAKTHLLVQALALGWQAKW